jgi:glutamine amidotransferase
MITIIDYGLGNIKSVFRALEKIGAEAVISSNPEDIPVSDGIVLPGVGAFRKAMKNITELRLYQPLMDYIGSSRPYLGICLGLQILFTESYEHGKTGGFDIIKGAVKRLPDEVKIPHMGWNQVSYNQSEEMFSGIKNNSYFYFDHSYYVDPDENGVTAGATDYGVKFVSAIQKGNLWGVQFHPEKSSEVGLKLLENFCRKCLPKE